MTRVYSYTAKELAAKFHEAYERLAQEHGYVTRRDTRQFDPESPNGRLMIAVCEEIRGSLLPENDGASVEMAKALLRAHDEGKYGHLIRAGNYYKEIEKALWLCKPPETYCSRYEPGKTDHCEACGGTRMAHQASPFATSLPPQGDKK